MNKEWSHEPSGYSCPFCLVVAGGKDKYSSQDDIVYRNEYVTALIAPRWWINNPGNVILLTNEHFENIYCIPNDVLAETRIVAKKIAIAMRDTYGCEGISTRQHNEPAGDQDVWHFHEHIFPRYEGDGLYENHSNKRFVEQSERLEYVRKLHNYFSSN